MPIHKIGSNISSSLTGILEGTNTWKGLMQNLAKELVSNFIADNVRMAADWAAKKASEVAIAAGAESEKTAAVAAGEAARTGLLTIGALEQDAIVVAGVAKSIIASAAETFAGIFGFLSPIMGPAAAGPAAAGQAVVMGVASHATGSWQLSDDMLSVLHKGEMVVPAASTPWAQSLMSNAASGGGQGGSDVHVHMNYAPVVQAMDGQSVGRVLQTHSDQLLKALDHGVKQGYHLSLKNLGRLR